MIEDPTSAAPKAPAVKSTAAPAAVDETPTPEVAAEIAATTVFEPDAPAGEVAAAEAPVPADAQAQVVDQSNEPGVTRPDE